MNKKKRCLILFFALFFLSFLSNNLFSQMDTRELPVKKIGIVFDGPWENNDKVLNLFVNEINVLTKSDFNVLFPGNKKIEADWSLANIKKSVDRLLADPEVDLILTMGVISSDYVCHKPDLSKPVIAPFVLDPENQKISLINMTSGVKNLSYVTRFMNQIILVKKFHEIVPFNRLTVLCSKPVYENVSNIEKSMIEGLQKKNIEPVIIKVGESVDEALSSIPQDTEAVFISPLLNVPGKDVEYIFRRLIERKLPTFSVCMDNYIEYGLFAGFDYQNDFIRMARRVAMNTQRIFTGEDPSALPVNLAKDNVLVINMKTAREISVMPSFVILTEAKIVNNELSSYDKEYEFMSVVHESIGANLDLAAEDRKVEAGKEDVKEAFSDYFPQISLEGDYTMIDDDRARTGIQPERSLNGSGTLSQLLFAEDTLANISIQKNFQEGRIERRQQIFLDLVLDTSISYLSILRSRTLEKIQRDNLELTNSNLKIAQIRYSTGVAGPGEVYRWQSELANNKITLLNTQARKQVSQVELNRILHRPLEEEFKIADVDLNDTFLLISDNRIHKFVDNPWSYKLFRDFNVVEGLAKSPELKQIESAIKAKKREITSLRWAFWSPRVSLEGDITQTFSKQGEGSNPPNDDTDMTLGFVATFPLVSGGAKIIRLRRAREELEALLLQRDSLSEKIENSIRSNLFVTGASYTNIKLAAEAAEAASKNLDLVKESYERGVATILDLLDAQNQAFVAKSEVANVKYLFLIQLMRFERSINQFDFFLNATMKNQWFERLEAYLNTNSK